MSGIGGSTKERMPMARLTLHAGWGKPCFFFPLSAHVRNRWRRCSRADEKPLFIQKGGVLISLGSESSWWWCGASKLNDVTGPLALAGTSIGGVPRRFSTSGQFQDDQWSFRDSQGGFAPIIAKEFPSHSSNRHRDPCPWVCIAANATLSTTPPRA